MMNDDIINRIEEIEDTLVELTADVIKNSTNKIIEKETILKEIPIKGDKGDDGISVKSAYIDSNRNLIIELSNGKRIACGVIPLPEKAVTIKDIYSNSDYRLIIEMSDGKLINGPLLPRGKDGISPDPINPVKVKDINIENDELIFNFDDNTQINAGKLPKTETIIKMGSGGGGGKAYTDEKLRDYATIEYVDSIETVVDHGDLTGLSDDDHTQYHTDDRALTWLGTRNTNDLAEGSNLYYTDARVESYLSGGDGISFSSGVISADITGTNIESITSGFSAGELLIGKIDGTLTNTALTGDAGITVINGDGVLSISANINTSNLKYTSSQINTIQDIDTTSSPEFAGLTLNTTPLSSLYGGTGFADGYSAGQILVGKTDGTLGRSTITANNGITVTNANGALGLGTNINTTNLKYTSSQINTIQDISTSSTPTFADITLTDLTDNGVVFTYDGDLEVDTSKISYNPTTGAFRVNGVTGSTVNQIELSAVSGGTQDASLGISAIGGTGLAKIDLYAGKTGSPRSSRVRFFSGTDSLVSPQWVIGNDYSSNGVFNLSFVDKGGARVLELTQDTEVGIGGVPDEILHIIKASTDNYIKVEAGGTTTNYAGIRFAEALLDYGHAIRMDASTDTLHFCSVDNTPTYTDHTTVTYGGNWSHEGTVTLNGGTTGASPSAQLIFSDYYDNAGNASISHLQLYTNYGFGISANQLNYISDSDHVFYDGTIELAKITSNGYLEINNPSSNVYNLNVNGNAHFGDAYDGGQYGEVQITRPSSQGDNNFHLSFIRAGNEIIGMGFLNNSSIWAIQRGSTVDNAGLFWDTNDNFGLNGSPSAGGGVGVIFVANVISAPTSNPTGGGIFYVESGALKYRGSSGTVTTLAPA